MWWWSVGGVLIMISEVMIHCTDVRAGLTGHYVISQLPHFPTFRPGRAKLLQITQLVGKQTLVRHYTVITNNKETRTEEERGGVEGCVKSNEISITISLPNQRCLAGNLVKIMNILLILQDYIAVNTV